MKALTLVSTLVLAALLAAAGEARAAEPDSDACPTDVALATLAPCGPGGDSCATFVEDLNLLVVYTPADAGGDCAPSELVAGVDCEDAARAATPWLAGVLGMCDAPYGLGLNSRHVRVARITSAAGGRHGAGANVLHGGSSPFDGWDDDAVAPENQDAHAPAPRAPRLHEDTLAPIASPAAPSPGRARVSFAEGAQGAECAGHGRRVDRPPRTV